METIQTTQTKTISPNEMQQKAIDILKGQVMLLAGPGTGKTFTVIHRIENMIKKGISPSSILCLTFSDAAANEMRQRLIKKIGVIASSLDIYTYHSFCNEIIKAYPTQFELAAGVKLITDSEKIAIMQECIDEANLDFFVPTRADKYYFTKNFISYIENLKSKRINKEDYLSCIETNPALMPRLQELESEIYEREQRGETRNKGRYSELEKIKNNIEKAKELWTLYELYSDKMIKKNLIDFSDMINFVLDEFENDFHFLNNVSNKYKYFLVDEYQDTNDLQNNIIFSLLNGNDEKNIFVVGDDDQIIYGFQGARIDSIENFLAHYPETKVICLNENNRSTQSILDFSYAVINQDINRLEHNEIFKDKNISKRLIAKNETITKQDKKVRRWVFGEKLQEMNYIIDDIANLINSPHCPVNEEGEKLLSEIAIISKKHSELQMFAEMLKAKNIPYQINEGKSIFSIRSSILIYFYLKVLTNHYLASDKLFGLMLAEPFKLDLDDYNKILHQQQLTDNDEHQDLISLMETMDGWKNQQKIDQFLTILEHLQTFIGTNDLRNSIIEIINRSGILSYFMGETENKLENLSAIKKVIDEASEYAHSNPTASIYDFVQYLDNCINNEIDITTDKNTFIRNAIQLTTYHGSKGREFECVYLPNLVAKAWENFSIPGAYKLITDEVPNKDTASAQKDSELLKLLFVGITRAKHTLTVSFANSEDGSAQQITKYLAALSDYDFDDKLFEYTETDFTKEFVQSISREAFNNRAAFINEIQERVKHTVLSPSRMNDYINCPRYYFYTKVLNIDIQESDWDNANFGTVIHKILEESLNKAKQTGEYPDIEQVKKDFIIGLNSMRFTSKVKKDNFKQLGNEIINNYYPYFIQIPPERVTETEFSFYGADVDGDLITGKIDRIEKNKDGTYSLYDYKTGKPVSPNQVALSGSKEGYYNQLCFYKYAFEKFTGKQVSQVGLIYVENHQKSVYKELTSEDMKYIEEKIRTTFANIKDLKFNPLNNSNHCKYCSYKHLCKLDLI